MQPVLPDADLAQRAHDDRFDCGGDARLYLAERLRLLHQVHHGNGPVVALRRLERHVAAQHLADSRSDSARPEIGKAEMLAKFVRGTGKWKSSKAGTN